MNLCIACDASEIECIELCGCCDGCDHRDEDEPAYIDTDDPSLPDDVALPGLEHDDDPKRWSKTSRGYLTHLAELDYPEPWTFWGLCTPARDLTDHRGDYLADETKCVWLIGGGRICRALVVIWSGAVLHDIEYSMKGARR